MRRDFNMADRGLHKDQVLQKKCVIYILFNNNFSLEQKWKQLAELATTKAKFEFELARGSVP
jgi:hypothetical protein